jgi:hypothetical protein
MKLSLHNMASDDAPRQTAARSSIALGLVSFPSSIFHFPSKSVPRLAALMKPSFRTHAGGASTNGISNHIRPDPSPEQSICRSRITHHSPVSAPSAVKINSAKPDKNQKFEKVDIATQRLTSRNSGQCPVLLPPQPFT